MSAHFWRRPVDSRRICALLNPAAVVLLTVTTAAVCSAAPVTARGDGGLTVGFDPARSAGLVQFRIRESGEPRQRDLLRAFYLVGTCFGQTRQTMPAPYVTDQSPKGFAYACSYSLRPRQLVRAYCLFFQPRNANVLFVRTRIRVAAAVSFSQKLQFRVEPTHFCGRLFWLPEGKPRKKLPVFGPWRLVHDKYPEQSTGVVMTDGDMFLAYGILRISRGDYWQARLPKGDTLNAEAPTRWGPSIGRSASKI